MLTGESKKSKKTILSWGYEKKKKERKKKEEKKREEEEEEKGRNRERKEEEERKKKRKKEICFVIAFSFYSLRAQCLHIFLKLRTIRLSRERTVEKHHQFYTRKDENSLNKNHGRIFFLTFLHFPLAHKIKSSFFHFLLFFFFDLASQSKSGFFLLLLFTRAAIYSNKSPYEKRRSKKTTLYCFLAKLSFSLFLFSLFLSLSVSFPVFLSLSLSHFLSFSRFLSRSFCLIRNGEKKTGFMECLPNSFPAAAAEMNEEENKE